MAAIIISRFDDLQNHIKPTDVHNAVLMMLYGSDGYHGIVRFHHNAFYLMGTRFISSGMMTEWFSDRSVNVDNILEFIKERWIHYSTGDTNFEVEVIIIRDPADIQSIVDKYRITNGPYINEIKSRFIIEKSIIPSISRTSESGDLVT